MLLILIWYSNRLSRAMLESLIKVSLFGPMGHVSYGRVINLITRPTLDKKDRKIFYTTILNTLIILKIYISRFYKGKPPTPSPDFLDTLQANSRHLADTFMRHSGQHQDTF